MTFYGLKTLSGIISTKTSKSSGKSGEIRTGLDRILTNSTLNGSFSASFKSFLFHICPMGIKLDVSILSIISILAAKIQFNKNTKNVLGIFFGNNFVKKDNPFYLYTNYHHEQKLPQFLSLYRFNQVQKR